MSNRNIVNRIAKMLDAIGIKYRVLVPEVIDISLGERCRRANRIYQETDGKCFVVSIHANAGGGTGWEVYTSKGQTKADAIATVFYNEAKKALLEPKYKVWQLNSKGHRYYYRYNEDGTPEFYPSVTIILSQTMPTPQHLVKWISDKGYEQAEAYKQERP